MLIQWQLGYSIAACFVCMTGRIGATYHISFPVVNRASFGIWGALWPVFNRAAMASIWYGVQGWIGGTCVRLMIRAIWTNWRDVCSCCESDREHPLTFLRLTLLEELRTAFPAPGPTQSHSSLSSSSGLDLYPSSGHQSTRFATSSLSRLSSHPLPVSPSSSGPLYEQRDLDLLSINPARLPAPNSAGSWSKAS